MIVGRLEVEMGKHACLTNVTNDVCSFAKYGVQFIVGLC